MDHVTQIAKNEAYWSLASEKDVAAAMAILSCLPSRPIANRQVERIAYKTALAGVTKHGLNAAVTKVLQGALGHGFMPSPPELRIQINAVMRPLVEARARELQSTRARHEQYEEAKARQKNINAWTREGRIRATEMWSRVKASL